MKLKYFLIATMFALGFVACDSNDDNTPDIDNPGVKGKTELTVRLKGVATLADGDLAEVKIFLFNDAEELEATAELGAPHVGLPTDIGDPIVSTCMEELTPGDKHLIVLANTVGLMDIPEEPSLDDILALKYVAEDPYSAADNAIMSSQVYDITLYEGTHTLYGFPSSGLGYPDDYTLMSTGNPIKLYRLVSKVNLENVTLAASDEYPEPELKIREVYVLRASAESMLAAAPQWGETNVKASNHFYGVEKERFDAFWNKESGNETVYIETYDPVTYTATYKLAYSLSSSEVDLVAGQTHLYNSTFFTYENTDIENWTLLVLRGDYSFKPKDTDSRVAMNERYYIIRIGDPTQGADFSAIADTDNVDFPERAPHAGMYRNVQYMIDNVTILGPGSAGSISEMTGDASLDVAMKVVGYGTVTQKPDF